jgi:hypothetical protein
MVCKTDKVAINNYFMIDTIDLLFDETETAFPFIIFTIAFINEKYYFDL